MKERFTFAILGGGARGQTFARWLSEHPEAGSVVAIAEPNAERRQIIAQMHEIPPAQQFETWEDLLAQPQLADVIINTLMDRQHAASVIPALKLGYHMLLEKPMATTREDCEAIDRVRRETGRIVSVCHSLRYHVVYAELKRLLAAGTIGKLITFDQLEAVDPAHFTHSFVRGNWSNELRSSFMLLSKSCHDVDVLAHLVDQPCRRVSSFGSLSYFRSENAPENAPASCLDGCPVEASCAYAAQKIYLRPESDWSKFLWTQQAPHVKTPEDKVQYLKASPYGRCVYRCDNDVVDHQVVNFEFEGGITGTFTMASFHLPDTRCIRLQGTEGCLRADLHSNTVEWRRFSDLANVRYQLPQQKGTHGGADDNLMANLIRALRANDPSLVLTTTEDSLASHKIVFAAELARREGRVVEL